MGQRLDEQKRAEILAAAADLFSSKPFHEVKLDDIAAAAKVGKGTLYAYFESKEDLHHSLAMHGFERLVSQMRDALVHAPPCPWEKFTAVVRNLVRFSRGNGPLLKIMRNAYLCGDARLDPVRRQVREILTQTIHDGIARGLLTDPRPDLTAEYVIACVRGVQLHGPADLDEQTQIDHLLHVIGQGLRAPAAKPTCSPSDSPRNPQKGGSVHE